MKKSFLAAALLVASTCLFAQDAILTPYSEHTTQHPSFMYLVLSDARMSHVKLGVSVAF